MCLCVSTRWHFGTIRSQRDARTSSWCVCRCVFFHTSLPSYMQEVLLELRAASSLMTSSWWRPPLISHGYTTPQIHRHRPKAPWRRLMLTCIQNYSIESRLSIFTHCTHTFLNFLKYHIFHFTTFILRAAVYRLYIPQDINRTALRWKSPERFNLIRKHGFSSVTEFFQFNHYY